MWHQVGYLPIVVVLGDGVARRQDTAQDISTLLNIILCLCEGLGLFCCAIVNAIKRNVWAGHPGHPWVTPAGEVGMYGSDVVPC